VTPFALLVRGDSGIKTFNDLEGKKVQTNVHATWSGGWYVQQMLKAHGLDPEKDVIPVTVAVVPIGWKQLAAGRVDAIITTMRGGKMVELESKLNAYALGMDKEALERLTKELVPGSQPRLVEKGSLLAREADIWTMGIPDAWAASADLPEEIVYKFVKAVLEHHMEYVEENKEMVDWGKDSAVLETFYVPYHAGAIKYYKEIGIWTDAAEQQQKKLLAAIKAEK